MAIVGKELILMSFMCKICSNIEDLLTKSACFYKGQYLQKIKRIFGENR